MQVRSGSSHDGAPLRVMLVDDDALTQEAYGALIEQAAHILIVGQAFSGREALRLLAHTPADVVVVDISLPDVSGIALVAQIKEQRPGLPCLVISGHDPDVYRERAFAAGARGYLDKKEAAEALVAAIGQVGGGGLYAPEAA